MCCSPQVYTQGLTQSVQASKILALCQPIRPVQDIAHKVGLITFLQFNDLDITLREMKIMNSNKKEINQLIEIYVYTSPITNTISISKDKFFILINIMF